jgi:hypothetical protein
VLMSVPVQPGSTFVAGQPTAVLKIPAGAPSGEMAGADSEEVVLSNGRVSTGGPIVAIEIAATQGASQSLQGAG